MIYQCVFCSYIWHRDRPYCPECGCHMIKQGNIESKESCTPNELESAEGSISWNRDEYPDDDYDEY